MNSGYAYTERIVAEGGGRTIATYLAWRYPHSSQAQWEERIRLGGVRLDGIRVESDRIVRPGQVLVWTRPAWEEPAAPLSFALLYRDAHLLAVLKPAGLPTLPGGGYLEHTLLHQVRLRYPDASPIHRIGRGTTGLVLCARSREAAATLGAAWADGRIRKFYRALVRGHPVGESYTVQTPIGLISHRPGFKVHASDPGGKPALSHVQVLERRTESSLVEVEIVTGRAHQVRIHLADSGHPLVGDPFYTDGGLPRLDAASGPGEGGFHLHSTRIFLTHPTTGRPLTLEAPPPPLLRASSES